MNPNRAAKLASITLAALVLLNFIIIVISLTVLQVPQRVVYILYGLEAAFIAACAAAFLWRGRTEAHGVKAKLKNLSREQKTRLAALALLYCLLLAALPFMGRIMDFLPAVPTDSPWFWAGCFAALLAAAIGLTIRLNRREK